MGIPASRRARCAFCERELDTEAVGVYQWTSGWVKVRAEGGGHGVSLPERENRWACRVCVDLAVRGTLKQGALF